MLSNAPDPAMPPVMLICNHCGKDFPGRAVLENHKKAIEEAKLRVPKEGDQADKAVVPPKTTAPVDVKLPDGELLDNASLINLERSFRKMAPKSDPTKPLGILQGRKKVGTLRADQIANVVHELLLRRQNAGFDIE